MTPGDIFVGIVLIAAVALLYWVVNDSQKKGAEWGGKLCGGCPRYCQQGRTCKGEPKHLPEEDKK